MSLPTSLPSHEPTVSVPDSTAHVPDPTVNVPEPTVSVIIPCWNAEATLAEAIESALAQTVEPLEVLVVDEGSSDRSVAIAASFGSPVRILHNTVGGPGAARQIGVNEARGEFIAFVDADDRLDPTKHAKQLALLTSRDPYTLVHTGSMIFDPDGRCPPTRRHGGESAVGNCLPVIFEQNPVCGASIMMRRSVILELGNYDADLWDTEHFGLSLIAATRCEFVYLPEPLYRVRRPQMSLSSREINLPSQSCHMATMHWFARERFRLRCPEAFATLPPQSVQQYMIEPVVQAAKEAHHRRDTTNDYRRLLRLARQLAPLDTEIRYMWHQRWIPNRWWRMWDRFRLKTNSNARSLGASSLAAEVS